MPKKYDVLLGLPVWRDVQHNYETLSTFHFGGDCDASMHYDIVLSGGTIHEWGVSLMSFSIYSFVEVSCIVLRLYLPSNQIRAVMPLPTVSLLDHLLG